MFIMVLRGYNIYMPYTAAGPVTARFANLKLW